MDEFTVKNEKKLLRPLKYMRHDGETQPHYEFMTNARLENLKREDLAWQAGP
jgi:hypothetical protein